MSEILMDTDDPAFQAGAVPLEKLSGYGLTKGRLGQMVDNGTVRCWIRGGHVVYSEPDIQRLLADRVESMMSDTWATYSDLARVHAVKRGFLDDLLVRKRVAFRFIHNGGQEFRVIDVLNALADNPNQDLPRRR